MRYDISIILQDRNGQISVAEIKRVFASTTGDVSVQRVFKEADRDNDGQVCEGLDIYIDFI